MREREREREREKESTCTYFASYHPRPSRHRGGAPMASSPPLRHRVQVRENSLVRPGNENKKRRVGAHILSGHQKHENAAANLVDAAGSLMDVMEQKGASL